ncbi:P-loop ATPase protein [Actinobaculum suis]|uniref:P-loop ATPase protein n=1 Tax=Actinobaculum suis TaxID=1657 RepID=A0A7Z8Y944_9ACTO|nr:P-loop ATPase protein [Actinobaculum suis]
MMVIMSDINDTSRIPKVVPQADAQAHLPPAQVPEIIVVTGMSGAGRTRAANTLEDLGWYVVDNLPPRLLKAMVGLMSPDGGVQRLAVVVDVRSREFFAELVGQLDVVRKSGVDYRIIFLDASNDELIQRFEAVRRPHPLEPHGRLLDGIRKERKLLTDLRNRADSVIDTTGLSVHDLARKIRSLVGDGTQDNVRITVMSFGFKYGLPMDADNVADVRFLPNPYWVSELRHLTGHDKPVADFVLEQAGAQEFVDKYSELLIGILAGYSRELKPYTTIAIGCTGGKHRSVAIAGAISEKLRQAGQSVRTIHRDLGRE